MTILTIPEKKIITCDCCQAAAEIKHRGSRADFGDWIDISMVGGMPSPGMRKQLNFCPRCGLDVVKHIEQFVETRSARAKDVS